MQIEQQPAYVLHTRPYRETSLLLECLTRDHGRLGVVARGVRGARAKLQRSELEPFQPLALGLVMRGELATLRSLDVVATSRRLLGDALFSGLYVNELVVRLCARQDPQPALYASYAETVRRLAGSDPLAWTLRRFERDLLEDLGYALRLHVDADDADIRPEASYRYVVEQGPQACRADAPRALRGADLLALAEDRCPDGDGLRRLRVMMREVLTFQLGGVELRAWRMLRPVSPRA